VRGGRRVERPYRVGLQIPDIVTAIASVEINVASVIFQVTFVKIGYGLCHRLVGFTIEGDTSPIGRCSGDKPSVIFIVL
jgi:hypothetical protein